VAGLRPATGETLWRKRIFLPPNQVPAGEKKVPIVDHTFLNSVPRIDGGYVVIGDGDRKGGEVRFRPDMNEEAILEQFR
jgi:hypothetical protein